MAFIAAGSGQASRPRSANSPQTVSISPATGEGANQVFTAVFSHPQGAAQITETRILFSPYVDGRKACYVYYDRPSASLLLVKDPGEDVTRAKFASGGSLENSQCVINVGASSARDNGQNCTVTLSVTFKTPVFSGAKNSYLYATDSKGVSTGYEQRGTWKVP